MNINECRVLQVSLALRFKFKTDLIINWIYPIKTHGERLGASLSDVRLCHLEDGLYVSLMSVVSLKKFVIYRGEYCKRCHNSHCTECLVLINMASYILKEGIAKVSGRQLRLKNK